MEQAQERIDEPENHCVTRRCRLCRFPIEMGEMAVAGRRLQQVYNKLPAEVCFMIAGELVREVAAMATEQLWQSRPRDLENCDIYNRIDMNVRARYIYIDGVRYVESLSSSPYAEGELVIDPATSSTIDAIHVLEDHIGVRRILFSSTEHSQKLEALLSTPVRDAWWRNIPFSTTVFYANFDGVKLRGIKTDGRGPRPVPSAAMQGKSTSEDVAWPRPMYPANEPVLHYSNLNTWEIEEERRNAEITPWTPFTRYRFRTVSFDCNDPAVTGYSVCFKSGIRGIYAHREEDLEMYNDVDMYTRTGIWMHMPVDPDERISAIWIRCQDTMSSSGLMVRKTARIPMTAY
ncbi:Hypothetical protein NCS54_01212200 [Fusarium falciforme]|uniref:Hypothetical protein n=1 Tax=Fusarium falciforme TaxID=195108 RepID=UPI00230047F0|nr:Hypothetical protein NCS54_01212200 [Fusarium falciforme]WAO94534.1 Hypothetical protein NCS54_01212200 [Fusarium falciforme]